MKPDYLMHRQEAASAASTIACRLARIARLSQPPNESHSKHSRPGRNALTRLIDTSFISLRHYVFPLHWLFSNLSAIVVYLYVRLVAITAHLTTSGEQRWTELSTPCVLALWHRDAPSLLVAFAKRRPRIPCAIMIASDPRGDYLAQLCGMLGFCVVRGDSEERGWEALVELGQMIDCGCCAVITADGNGPALVARIGAIALASAAGVPLIPLSAKCHPAVEERHKWDRARNPIPFSNLTVMIGEGRRFDCLNETSSIEEGRRWLEECLNSLLLGSQ